MLEWRFKAYRLWLEMKEPKWPNVHYPQDDYNDIIYYAPAQKKKLNSLDELDPEIKRTYENSEFLLKNSSFLLELLWML